jgi:uncharacterized membrane protein (DUF4010 family)
MLTFDPVILSLAVALGIGLLIGTERERRKGERPAPSSAGIRTFTLASLTGALSTIIGGELLFAITIGGAFALTAFAYWRGFRDDPGLTTEVALIVTVLLGGLAMTRPSLAAGVAVAVTIVLIARTPLHRFVRSVLSEDEIKDALMFGAATLIVLPLLPNEQMGPFDALNPHAILVIVILVMAIGALGHIAVRLLGAHFGLPIAGLASGFISSIATTGAMGARAAKMPELVWPAAAGAALSSVATILELALLIAVTNLATLQALFVPLACAGATAAAYGIALAIRAIQENQAEPDERGRAFSLWTALIFAAMLSGILLASRALNTWFGVTGVIAAAAIAGFANADPAAISVAALVGSSQISTADAALTILIAFSTNTIAKLILSIVSGGTAFALRIIPGLILMVLAAWAGWWLR